MTGPLVIVALVAAILAAVFFLQWQSASKAVLALRGEADAARKDMDGARAEQKKAQDELKQQKSLLVDTREKLAEARKKGQEKKPQQSRSSREAELEEDLQHARRLTEEAHAAEQSSRKERDEARAALAPLKAEVDKLQARVRELSSRPAPQAAPAPVAAAAPAAPDRSAELDALKRELSEAQNALKEAKRKEQDLREDIRRYRGRAETNNRVYLVTKGELDLTKERLAQAERKLWQAGIPLTPPEKKERPKATGPAAADKPREEKPAAAEAQPASPAPEMPTAASVPPPAAIPTPVETPTPTAVQPIRRRPEDAEAKPENS